MTRDRIGSHGSTTPDHKAGTPTSPTYLGSSLTTYSRSPAHSPSLSSRVSDAEPDSSGVVTPDSIPSRKTSAYREHSASAPRDSSTPVTSSSAKDSSTGMVTAVSEQVSDNMVDRQPVALSPTPRDSHLSLSLIRTGSLHEESSLSVIEESQEVLNSNLSRPRSQTLPRNIKLSPASGQLEQTGGINITENGNEAQEVVETTRAVGEGTSNLTAVSSTRATNQIVRVEAVTRDSPVTLLSRGGKRNFSIFTPHKVMSTGC